MATMSIQTVVVNTQSLADLLKLVEVASEEVSFWCGRYVIVEGYQGTLSIDALAACLFILAAKDVNFNEIDRAIGKQIVSKIDQLYTSNEARWNRSNLFTYILAGIRDLLSNSKWNTRLRWELKHSELIFELYTRQQFFNKYGRIPCTKPQWSSSKYLYRWAPLVK